MQGDVFLKGFMVLADLMTGWMFRSEMGFPLDTTFTFPKSVAKSAMWLIIFLRNE